MREAVGVRLAVGVRDDVGEAVNEAVPVGVRVDVGVIEGVGVRVGVNEIVDVCEGVGVRVFVTDGIGVGVDCATMLPFTQVHDFHKACDVSPPEKLATNSKTTVCPLLKLVPVFQLTLFG